MKKRHRRKFIEKYGCDPLEVWNIDTWLVRASHYQGKPAGEVVSRGSIDPQDALNDWINSPEHFKALINPEFDNIGIGLCPKLYPGYTQAVNFWVVDFGYDMV